MSRKSKNKLKTKRKKRLKKSVRGYGRRSCRGEYAGLKYESALELATILHCHKVGLSITRPEIEPTIQYISKSGTIHRYYPDFIIGGCVVAEVKGFLPSKEKDRVFRKRLALQMWCAKNNMWELFITKDMISPVYFEAAKKIHNKMVGARFKKNKK